VLWPNPLLAARWERAVPRALLIEDDRQTLEALAEWLRGAGLDCRTAASLEKARAELQDRQFDLIVADLKLPDGEALELLPQLEESPPTQLLIVTGHPSTDSAVESFRGGAVDYLTKPIDLERLRKVVSNVLRTAELRQEVEELRDELRSVGRFGKMIGASPPMQQLYDQILKVSRAESTVLITGETGVGKELVAETIHALSHRAKQPFLPVNCAAVSSTLIESELFGHERGSFTGATQRHRGFFERADTGSLFLDEITEMPNELQVKLLRALEAKQVRRIGGDRQINVDVRVIAATNCDPEEAVRGGKLRKDLLYRLLVVPIHIPPLRGRGDDVELIANHRLARLNQESRTTKRFTEEALEELRTYPWPGNVRELLNAVEQAYVLGPDRIGPECLPIRADTHPVAGEQQLGIHVGQPIAEVERRLILATLKRYHGDKKKTAHILGISLKTLYNRLNRYSGSST
jgi:DNA-binding NtrC family response regulator